jgi:hypothetical protein
MRAAIKVGAVADNEASINRSKMLLIRGPGSVATPARLRNGDEVG